MGVRTFGASCLTSEQQSALTTAGIDVEDVKDNSCTSPLLNTCERDALQLLSEYPIYNPSSGIYSKWGDIALSWDTENLLSDEKWSVASFTDEFAYRIGDTVIVIENDGYRLGVYTATANVPSPAGAFDHTKWTLLCSVVTSEPVGLPSIQDLLSKYEYYNPKAFLTSWDEFGSEWEADLTSLNSDLWSDAKIAKTNYYEKNDIVLYDSATGDYTCVYVATSDMPVTTVLVPNTPPPSDFWSKLYCVRNGKEVVGVSTCEGGYSPVSLSSGDNDLICVPVESTIGIGQRVYGD